MFIPIIRDNDARGLHHHVVYQFRDHTFGRSVDSFDNPLDAQDLAYRINRSLVEAQVRLAGRPPAVTVRKVARFKSGDRVYPDAPLFVEVRSFSFLRTWNSPDMTLHVNGDQTELELPGVQDRWLCNIDLHTGEVREIGQSQVLGRILHL